MEFDFKITTWERVTVPKEFEEKVLDGIKDGSITSAEDIFNLDIDADCNKLDDVDEQMTVDENGGCATIDVLEDGNSIYTNAED
jgi:hypothetical protein